ncbi:hypothetical protein M885DRAFT_587308 [Pelagophyceae sp. CCMP2097]|nr:hypothetical protein M885DRAFT_587308 [Pelagophyceae sp. CCMP2097]
MNFDSGHACVGYAAPFAAQPFLMAQQPGSQYKTLGSAYKEQLVADYYLGGSPYLLARPAAAYPVEYATQQAALPLYLAAGGLATVGSLGALPRGPLLDEGHESAYKANGLALDASISLAAAAPSFAALPPAFAGGLAPHGLVPQGLAPQFQAPALPAFESAEAVDDDDRADLREDLEDAARTGPPRACRVSGCPQPASPGSRIGCCDAHGPRRCEFPGCGKCAQGGAQQRCVAHGGGRRCQVPGCGKGARDKYFCASHGGGSRCQQPGCDKGAVGGTARCTAHGGGRRCRHDKCIKGAIGRTGLCTAHGGGRRCNIIGCTKSAVCGTARCTAHGGYHRSRRVAQLAPHAMAKPTGAPFYVPQFIHGDGLDGALAGALAGGMAGGMPVAGGMTAAAAYHAQWLLPAHLCGQLDGEAAYVAAMLPQPHLGVVDPQTGLALVQMSLASLPTSPLGLEPRSLHSPAFLQPSGFHQAYLADPHLAAGLPMPPLGLSRNLGSPVGPARSLGVPPGLAAHGADRDGPQLTLDRLAPPLRLLAQPARALDPFLPRPGDPYTGGYLPCAGAALWPAFPPQAAQAPFGDLLPPPEARKLSPDALRHLALLTPRPL